MCAEPFSRSLARRVQQIFSCPLSSCRFCSSTPPRSTFTSRRCQGIAYRAPLWTLRILIFYLVGGVSLCQGIVRAIANTSPWVSPVRAIYVGPGYVFRVCAYPRAYVHVRRPDVVCSRRARTVSVNPLHPFYPHPDPDCTLITLITY